jgi:hypothetical protein
MRIWCGCAGQAKWACVVNECNGDVTPTSASLARARRRPVIRSLVPSRGFGLLFMPQFELILHSWLSWDFSVVQGDSVVAEIEIPRWRKRAVLKVGGLHYAAYREGVIGGAFILALDTTQLARAERGNWLSRSFTIKQGEKTYRLKAEWFGSSFILLDNEQEVGSVVPCGMFTRKTRVSLPDELPLLVQIFVIWLTLYQREIDASAPVPM